MHSYCAILLHLHHISTSCTKRLWALDEFDVLVKIIMNYWIMEAIFKEEDMNFIHFECIMIRTVNRLTFITCVYNKFRMVEILHSLMLYEYLLLSIWSIYILPCKKCLWCAQRIWNQRRGKSSFTYFTIIKLSGVSKTSIARIIPKLTYCIEKLKKKQRE